MLEYFFDYLNMHKIKYILLERLRQYRTAPISIGSCLSDVKIAIEQLTAPIVLGPNKTLTCEDCEILFKKYGRSLLKKYLDTVSDLLKKDATGIMSPTKAKQNQARLHEQLVINKQTDDFYIAIVNKDGHTFIAVGVQHANDKHTILARVGKIFRPDNSPNDFDCDFPVRPV